MPAPFFSSRLKEPMHPSASKGNNPALWNKLLDFLDEKLQLGLLDHLRRVASYHFEAEVLYVEPAGGDDLDYLSRPVMQQQLQLLAEEAVRVTKVVVKKAGA